MKIGDTLSELTQSRGYFPRKAVEEAMNEDGQERSA